MNSYNDTHMNETYNKFINKITQVTRNNNNINFHEYQNRRTINNNNYSNNNSQDFNKISYNFSNNQQKEIPQNNKQIYEKMNQKLFELKNNSERNLSLNINNNIPNNGSYIPNENINKSNKIFYNNKNDYPLGGGKNAPIVKILNQYNNQSTSYQDIDFNEQNNNRNDSDKNEQIFLENSNQINNHIYSTNNLRVYNSNQNNIQSNSANDNPQEPKKNSRLASSLLYGLIFGAVGTLLLWCKNPGVREYLKACYHNINSESILNFFKSFLHPMDLIKSLGNNIVSFKGILKESLVYLIEFFEEYSDIWRLLGIIVMVYILWFIIKIIFRKIKGCKKKKKKARQDENLQITH